MAGKPFDASHIVRESRFISEENRSPLLEGESNMTLLADELITIAIESGFSSRIDGAA